MTTRCTLGPQFPPVFHRPFLRYIDGEQGGGDGGEGSGGEENAPKFPANTPVKDMTSEQQVAYWQHQSRKHEGRAKAFGELTPEQVRELQAENANLKSANQSDADKAIEAAREEGRTEVRAVLNRERAKTALDKALVGRMPNAIALLDLDITKFVVNGNVDTDAVTAWVEDNSTAGQQRGGALDLGQGKRGDGNHGTSKSVSAGRDLYADRHKKKNSTTTS